MNKAIFKGRLTRDPDIRYGADDNHTAYARFTIAVTDRKWKVDENNFHTDFIPCKAIGKVAELAETNLCKGKEMLLYGKMQSGSYEKDGKTIYTLNFLVQEIEFCGKKEDSPMPYDAFMNIPEGMDEELPFR